MNFELLIENNIKRLNLKRVRIKVDPSLVFQAEDLSQCNGYEGYILAETGDVPKVLVMSPDGVSSVMDIPQQFLQTLMSDEESEALRAFKNYICDICELDTTTPEAEILLNASTIEEVEAILKQVGLTDEELKVLYRNFITDDSYTVNEGVFSSLLNAAKTTAHAAARGTSVASKLAGGALKGTGAIYSALVDTKGGAAISKAGNTLTQKGKDLGRWLDNIDFNRKHLQEYKDYTKKKYPKLAAIVDDATSIDDVHKKIKKAVPDATDTAIKRLYTDFFKTSTDPEIQDIVKTNIATPITTGPSARTAEGNPIPGQSRFNTADGKKSYLFTKNGWSLLDPKNKNKLLADPAIQQRVKTQNKNITTQWQKTLKILPAK